MRKPSCASDKSSFETEWETSNSDPGITEKFSARVCCRVIMLKDRRLLDLFKTLVRAYPKESAVVTLTLFLAGLAEGIGIATLLPLLGLVAGGEARNNTELGRMIADTLQAVGIQPTVGMLIVLILVLMTAKTGLILLAARQWSLYAARVETNFRMEFIRALMGARWE